MAPEMKEKLSADVVEPAGKASSPASAEDGPPPRRHGLKTFSSFYNNRDYRFLWVGNLSGNVGQWLQVFTVGWLVLEISGGSALQSATAVGIRSLPVLVLGPWTGAMVDRLDRRKFAIVLQLWMAIAAVLFAVLVASGHVQVWHAYAYALLNGIGFTSMSTVRQSLIANTVRRSDLANAVALNSMGGTSTRLLGPLIAGILITTTGFVWSFALQSALYVGMFLLLLPMKTPYREDRDVRQASIWAYMAQGARYIWGNPALLQLNVVNVARTIVFQPVMFLLPVYTREVLSAGAGTGTALMTAMAIGGLTAGFIITSWRFFTKRGVVSMTCLAGASVCMVALGQSHWVWLSIAVMTVMGFFQANFLIANQTSIQTIVPDYLRGRVTSVWHYLDGLIPMWVFLLGLLAEFAGVSLALTVVGIGVFATSTFFLIRFKEMRSLG